MKKILFLLLSIFTVTLSVKAQVVDITYGSPDLFIKGGSEGKNYAVSIKTSKTNKEQVQITLDFLKSYNLIEGNQSVDKIDDNLSQITIPILFRYPRMLYKGLMGVGMPTAPVSLTGNLSFFFDKEKGEVTLGLDNFQSKALVLSKKALDISYPVNYKEEDLNEEQRVLLLYRQEGDLVVASNSFVTKLLLTLNGNLDRLGEIRQRLSEYFEDLESKYEVYDKLEAMGLAHYSSPLEVLEMAKNSTSPGHKYVVAAFERDLADGRLIGFYQKIWDGDSKKIINTLFKGVAEVLDGKITTVLEDGKDTFTLVDDKLLPVDEKLRKKYIKKGLQF